MAKSLVHPPYWVQIQNEKNRHDVPDGGYFGHQKLDASHDLVASYGPVGQLLVSVADVGPEWDHRFAFEPVADLVEHHPDTHFLAIAPPYRACVHAKTRTNDISRKFWLGQFVACRFAFPAFRWQRFLVP